MPRGQPPYHTSNPPEQIRRPTRSRSAAAVSAETADSNAVPTPATNKKKKNPDRVKNSLIAAQITPPPLYKFMLEIKAEKSPLKTYQPWLLLQEQQRQIT
jgi:hypothetical protein